MYNRTGLSTKCTPIKTGFKNLCTGTEAKFRPSVDALVARLQKNNDFMAWAHYTSSSNCSAIPCEVFKFGGSLGLFHNCSENLRKANLRNQLS